MYKIFDIFYVIPGQRRLIISTILIYIYIYQKQSKILTIQTLTESKTMIQNKQSQKKNQHQTQSYTQSSTRNKNKSHTHMNDNNSLYTQQSEHTEQNHPHPHPQPQQSINTSSLQQCTQNNISTLYKILITNNSNQKYSSSQQQSSQNRYQRDILNSLTTTNNNNNNNNSNNRLQQIFEYVHDNNPQILPILHKYTKYNINRKQIILNNIKYCQYFNKYVFGFIRQPTQEQRIIINQYNHSNNNNNNNNKKQTEIVQTQIAVNVQNIDNKQDNRRCKYLTQLYKLLSKQKYNYTKIDQQLQHILTNNIQLIAQSQYIDIWSAIQYIPSYSQSLSTSQSTTISSTAQIPKQHSNISTNINIQKYYYQLLHKLLTKIKQQSSEQSQSTYSDIIIQGWQYIDSKNYIIKYIIQKLHHYNNKIQQQHKQDINDIPIQQQQQNIYRLCMIIDQYINRQQKNININIKDKQHRYKDDLNWKYIRQQYLYKNRRYKQYKIYTILNSSSMEQIVQILRQLTPQQIHILSVLLAKDTNKHNTFINTIQKHPNNTHPNIRYISYLIQHNNITNTNDKQQSIQYGQHQYHQQCNKIQSQYIHKQQQIIKQQLINNSYPTYDIIANSYYSITNIIYTIQMIQQEREMKIKLQKQQYKQQQQYDVNIEYTKIINKILVNIYKYIQDILIRSHKQVQVYPSKQTQTQRQNNIPNIPQRQQILYKYILTNKHSLNNIHIHIYQQHDKLSNYSIENNNNNNGQLIKILQIYTILQYQLSQQLTNAIITTISTFNKEGKNIQVAIAYIKYLSSTYPVLSSNTNTTNFQFIKSLINNIYTCGQISQSILYSIDYVLAVVTVIDKYCRSGKNTEKNKNKNYSETKDNKNIDMYMYTYTYTYLQQYINKIFNRCQKEQKIIAYMLDFKNKLNRHTHTNGQSTQVKMGQNIRQDRYPSFSRYNTVINISQQISLKLYNRQLTSQQSLLPTFNSAILQQLITNKYNLLIQCNNLISSSTPTPIPISHNNNKLPPPSIKPTLIPKQQYKIYNLHQYKNIAFRFNQIIQHNIPYKQTIFQSDYYRNYINMYIYLESIKVFLDTLLSQNMDNSNNNNNDVRGRQIKQQILQKLTQTIIQSLTIIKQIQHKTIHNSCVFYYLLDLWKYIHVLCYYQQIIQKLLHVNTNVNVNVNKNSNGRQICIFTQLLQIIQLGYIHPLVRQYVSVVIGKMYCYVDKQRRTRININIKKDKQKINEEGVSKEIISQTIKQDIQIKANNNKNCEKIRNTYRKQMIQKLMVDLNNININVSVPIMLVLGYQMLEFKQILNYYTSKEDTKDKDKHGDILAIQKQYQQIFDIFIRFISCHHAYIRSIAQYYIMKIIQIDKDKNTDTDKDIDIGKGKDMEEKNKNNTYENNKNKKNGFLQYLSNKVWKQDKDCIRIMRNIGYTVQGFKQAMNKKQSQIFLCYQRVQEYPTQVVLRQMRNDLIGILEYFYQVNLRKINKMKEQKNFQAIKYIKSMNQNIKQRIKITQNLNKSINGPRVPLVLHYKQPQIIIIASLLEKVHNFGYILRTLHQKRATLLVPSKQPLQHPQCQQFIPQNSQVQIIQIKQSQLDYFIKLKKSLGYPLIGLQQCAGSVKIEQYTFPTKYMLLLGNQRLGAPAALLNQADVLVQIPQVGKVRSLNVHVSMVICMWQSIIKNQAKKTE